MFQLDSQEKIVLAKTYSILGKYFDRAIQQTEDGEIILRCAGLSSLVDKYKTDLIPYYMNGIWKNDNPQYSPVKTCFAICQEIENNKQALGSFLKEIFDRTRKIEGNDFEILSNYLEIIGYELTREHIEDDYEYDLYKYQLTAFSEGAIGRQEDKTFLLAALEQKHGDLLPYYLEAISNYGNSEYKSCLDNTRSVFEGFFKKLDSQNDYAKGILVATNESIIDNSNTQLVSIKKIFTYWLDNKKGANRYRLFVSMYSAMSGLGTHGEEIPSKEDALMFLRITEDILIWCLQHNIGY
ncbi:hypothetical protein [Faecalicatena contorta]|uniref:Uncharacterized protein n=1 Tax=Faecalicatena contorta TaxID=39482 RepID=A0A315ZST3_9FIRM|nr:hypothetical protein [Faecalicatena contorta]PWJ47794.1 hypothetical protein A8805_11649 [Faecalicatena contorta]SUQ15788.1 hypothetical protein SAMN05216529_11649 [Faecalicatena contorta]